MSTLSENAVMSSYAIAATTVALQIVALALWTGRIRLRVKQWVNPEDARTNKGEAVDRDHPDVERVKRAHMNLLENAVPFFVVGALYASTAPSKTAAYAYFGAFVGARLLHTAFYLANRQPFRTLSFGVGVLAILGMGVHVIRVAL